MHYFYIFNLFIIVVILYRIIIGAVGGLFNESINLLAFMFSSALSITFFESLGKLINNYLYPDMAKSLVMSLWLIFIVTYAVLWLLKSSLMRKIFQYTGEKKVALPKGMDISGGMVCGLTLGGLILSFLILSFYVAPVPEDLYDKVRIKDGVMFRVDEFLPRAHAAIRKVLPPEARFDWESFLNKYKGVETEEEEEKKEKEEKGRA